MAKEQASQLRGWRRPQCKCRIEGRRNHAFFSALSRLSTSASPSPSPDLAWPAAENADKSHSVPSEEAAPWS